MSEFIDYVVAFAVLLGLLIVVHEFGHYLVARLCGVKVLRFSLGFGRPLLVRKAGADQTESDETGGKMINRCIHSNYALFHK